MKICLFIMLKKKTETEELNIFHPCSKRLLISNTNLMTLSSTYPPCFRGGEGINQLL